MSAGLSIRRAPINEGERRIKMGHTYQAVAKKIHVPFYENRQTATYP